MKRLHASSRRDVLLASGMLFAWPHLPKLAHAEGRDPRFVLKGLLKDHLRADERVLAGDVFPGSAGVRPVTGLVA